MLEEILKAIKNTFNEVIKLAKNIIDAITKKGKWKIKFYLNGQCVCSKWVADTEAVFNSAYVVTIFGKKHLFGSNLVRTVIRPEKLLYKDIFKKEIHVGAYLFEGIEV